MNKPQNSATILIRKIVVATDFSPASNRAFAFSNQLAKQVGAEVVSVFVKDSDDLAIAIRQNMPVRQSEIKKLKPKVNKVIQEKFQSLLKTAKSGRNRFIIREGNPLEEILKVAKKEKAALIVTGTRSRSLLSDMLLGSTTRELILKSFCPVVTVNERSRTT